MGLSQEELDNSDMLPMDYGGKQKVIPKDQKGNIKALFVGKGQKQSDPSDEEDDLFKPDSGMVDMKDSVGISSFGQDDNDSFNRVRRFSGDKNLSIKDLREKKESSSSTPRMHSPENEHRERRESFDKQRKQMGTAQARLGKKDLNVEMSPRPQSAKDDTDMSMGLSFGTSKQNTSKGGKGRGRGIEFGDIDQDDLFKAKKGGVSPDQVIRKTVTKESA